ncbi:hypothetical protein DPMN_023953 [Dreissena polymorpha]|uniref:C3H1-type domain-containing protein n=1 Tax=Dreissena polymorpha TaxID=45954 RepID=A0A9D4LNW0_DREPO|nr:hypothetical protein DPMN_023953 [Dreissena polymorpha]
MSVYLSFDHNKSKTQELLKYFWTIREAAYRQGGSAWRTYDEQFRLRLGISPSPWSEINNDLWWRCILVQPANARTSGTFLRPSRDQYTCNYFNQGSCRLVNCRFPHNCSRCRGNHPAINCQSVAEASGVAQRANTPRFDAPFRGRNNPNPHRLGQRQFGQNRGNFSRYTQ